jgi:hypothetical protein
LLAKLPKAGFIDQATPVLLVPLTAAVKVWLCDGCKETEVGVNEIITGMSLTVALPDAAGFIVLVAVSVTFWTLVMADGAVYTPVLVMVPMAGFNVH